MSRIQTKALGSGDQRPPCSAAGRTYWTHSVSHAARDDSQRSRGVRDIQWLQFEQDPPWILNCTSLSSNPNPTTNPPPDFRRTTDFLRLTQQGATVNNLFICLSYRLPVFRAVHLPVPLTYQLEGFLFCLIVCFTLVTVYTGADSFSNDRTKLIFGELVSDSIEGWGRQGSEGEVIGIVLK